LRFEVLSATGSDRGLDEGRLVDAGDGSCTERCRPRVVRGLDQVDQTKPIWELAVEAMTLQRAAISCL
jgi:hypothetical protein